MGDLLDFRIEITPEESEHLERIRHQFPPTAEGYLAWLTDCTERLFRRPPDLEPPLHFDRPFELPPPEPSGPSAGEQVPEPGVRTRPP